jgi:HEAT repeat protein
VRYSPPRSFFAAVWLIGVLALVPSGHAQTDGDSGASLKKSLENVSKALASNSPAKQAAALSLLPGLKLSPAESAKQLNEMARFAPQTKSEEVQIAWLLTYGKLHLRPDDSSNDQDWPDFYLKFPSSSESAKLLEPLLNSSSVKVRQAASESLTYLVVATIQRLDKPSVTPRSLEREMDNDERLAIGGGLHPIASVYQWLPLFFDGEIERFDRLIEPYMPLLKSTLTATDSASQKWAMESLRSLAVSISENLPDPTLKREKELAVKPYQAKIKFLLFEPILKKANSLTSHLLGLLQSTDPEVRQMAHRTAESVANARRLARMTQNYEPSPGMTLIPISAEDALLPGLQTLVPTLFTSLKSNDPAVRLYAIEALEYYESALWSQRGPIVAATKDSSPFVRWVAARSIGKMLPKSGEHADRADALAALTQMLTDTDIDARLSALNALLRWGDSGSGAAEGVMACVSKGDVDSRLAAIATLEAIKPDPTRATQVLIAALEQDDFRIRRAAAATLGRLGAKAKAAIPALEKVLNDPDPELRRIAGEAVLAID